MTRRGLIHTDDESAVVPEAAEILADLRAGGLAHRWVRHVRSSQAFALNLFAPLTEDGIRRVFWQLGHEATVVDRPVFEFEDPADRLQEASKRSPHRTQVDVLLRGRAADGRRVASLIEVKFSESNYGTCSAFDSAANPNRDACATPGLFGRDPGQCFQLLNHGYGSRRYAEYLSDVTISGPSGVADDGGCYVRQGRSQPMRNLALAHLLVREGDFDEVVFATCAPAAHPTIWRRFEEFRTVFSDTERVTIRPLTAEFVSRGHSDHGAAFTVRYSPALTEQALLHLSSDGSEVLGVWVLRDGGAQSHYLPQHVHERDYAEAVILGEDWDTLVERLPRSSPYGAWWEAVPCGPVESPREVLERVRLT